MPVPSCLEGMTLNTKNGDRFYIPDCLSTIQIYQIATHDAIEKEPKGFFYVGYRQEIPNQNYNSYHQSIYHSDQWVFLIATGGTGKFAILKESQISARFSDRASLLRHLKGEHPELREDGYVDYVGGKNAHIDALYRHLPSDPSKGIIPQVGLAGRSYYRPAKKKK